MATQKIARAPSFLHKVHDFVYYKLPDSWRGTLDFLYNRAPYLRPFGGAFNGQQFRRLIFNELLFLLPFELVVETGAYTGNTTEYMSEHILCPFYAVEQSAKFCQYSKLRLRHRDHVHLVHDDSRTFLKSLSVNQAIAKGLCFFYLDAHWGPDLPLADELQIIVDAWSDPVIMIDDFQVPGDSGYNFDDYGEGAALTLDYIPTSVITQLAIFFPSVPSTRETGRKRGCVVLAKHGLAADVVRQAHYLREHHLTTESSATL